MPRIAVSANNPFNQAKAQRRDRFIDPTKLKIANDPLVGRARPANKYAEIFEAMKPGQCIVCASDEAAALCGAMKKWIENTGAKCVAKFTTRYSDGKGRVWLLADPAKAKLKAAA